VGFSQMASVDSDHSSVDSDCSVCLSAKWCSVDSDRSSVDSDCSVCLSAKWCSVDSVRSSVDSDCSVCLSAKCGFTLVSYYINSSKGLRDYQSTLTHLFNGEISKVHLLYIWMFTVVCILVRIQPF
jgi:hypothetical protein